MKYNDKIKLKFKIISKVYDYYNYIEGIDKKNGPRYALPKNIPNDQLKILDVCSGTSESSLVLGKVNSKNKIIGIDLSADMISYASSKIKKSGLDNIIVQIMDAGKLEFNDKEFDTAMVSFALHEMDYELMTKVLHEVYRVLKKNGKFIIIDFDNKVKSKKLLIKILYFFHIKFFEPDHMNDFFCYKWNDILKKIGFQISSIDKYSNSFFLIAEKG